MKNVISIGLRIKERRKALKMSAEELGKILGKDRSTIYRYEKGEIENLPIELLNPIAKALDTTPEYLMGWDVEKILMDAAEESVLHNAISEDANLRSMVKAYQTLSDDEKNAVSKIVGAGSLPKDAIPFTTSDVRPLPVLGWVNCGSPHFADEHVEGYIETDYATAPDNTYFWLHATGNSMENIGIRDGDLLLIRQQNTIENGEIAVVMVGDDTATLKRVILKENTIILMPENNAYEPQVFTGKETQNVKICGRLMEVRKRF